MLGLAHPPDANVATRINRVQRYLYWCAVAVLFAIGTWERFKLPQTPLSDPDTFGFVNPALDVLARKGFHHTAGHAYVYPAFILAILRLFGDFRAIAVIQHLIGLSGGCALLFAWRGIRSLVPSWSLPIWAHDCAGLLLLTIYMTGRIPVNFEHQIRPEAITGAFCALNLWLTVAFVRWRFISRRTPHDLIAGGFLLFNSFLLFALKPSFGLTLCFATAPVWISLFRTKEAFGQKALLLLPALAACGLLWLPEPRLSREDKFGQMFFSETLFTIHARQIAEQMDSDLSHQEALPYDRAWLEKTAAYLREEIADSTAQRKPWITLGFNPDHLLFDDSICRRLESEIRNPEERRRFYYYWYLHTFHNSPVAMLRKICSEMAQFFGPGNAYRDYPSAASIGSKYALSANSFQFWPKPIHRTQVGLRYLSDCSALSGNLTPLGEPSLTKIAIVCLARAYLPILIVTLCAAIVSFKCKALSEYRRISLIVILLYSYNLGNSLPTAVVHSLSVERYIRTQFAFTLFAEIVALAVIVDLGLFLWNRRVAPPR